MKRTLIKFGALIATIAGPIAATISCSKTNKKRIAFVKSTDNSSYDSLLSNVGAKYAKIHGYDWDEYSSAADVGKEEIAVSTIINSKKYKSVIFQPVDVSADGSLKNLKKLLDAELYVAIPDRIFSKAQIDTLSSAQKEYLTLQVTSDNEQIAKDAAAKLVKYWIRKTTINATATNFGSRRIVLVEGEPGSSSNEARKRGFNAFFTSDISSIYENTDFNISNIKELTANWQTTKAQEVFDALINNVKANGGIGAFAANDQMAHGLITSSSMKDVIGNDDYPIVTVDAHKAYKGEITYDASGSSSKKVIANFAQRTETTMKLAVHAILWNMLGEDFKGANNIKWVIDDASTNSDDGKTSQIPTLSTTLIYNQLTIKLPGIAITRDADGNLQNEMALVD